MFGWEQGITKKAISVMSLVFLYHFRTFLIFFLSSGVLAEAAVVPGQLRGVQQQQDQTEIGRHHQRALHHQNFNQEISEN